MSEKGKKASFIAEIKGILESVEELQLSWCRVIAFPGGKLGGWVSENYLGLSRLLKWFYSHLANVSVDKEFTEPTTPWRIWNGAVCKAWLKSRGKPTAIDKKALVAADLKASVRAIMTCGEEIPGPLPEKGGPVEVVLLTIMSLQEMLSWLMQDTIPDDSYYGEAERRIRVFLTHYSEICLYTHLTLPTKRIV